MKVETLQDRIEKAEQKVTKKQGTIEKKEKAIEKKISLLDTKYHFTWTGTRQYSSDLKEMGFNSEDANEIYWIECDIEDYLDDIERIKKEIPEIQKTIEKYKEQLSAEIEVQETYITEVPEAMKQMEVELVQKWDEFDMNRREFLENQYKELGYTAFIKKHKFSGYNFMQMEDEEIHKRNEKDARMEVLDLLNRVKEVTGEVTDWSGIRLTSGNSFPVLNGMVVGKEGKAVVESIMAGGYNIQRLHIRTLVKAF